MQTVITANLNGNAYQLEETAYAALREYLERAEGQLKDNPDKAEILADLEQAIADKCQRFLGPHKTVVSAQEIQQIVMEMGPVEGPWSAPDGEGAKASSEKAKVDADAPKRLYKIREGSMLSGVCMGLSAYMHVDVTIIRVVFVVLTLVSKGGFALVYLGLMFILPHANTSEEHAAAHGAPFNAQQLVDDARKSVDEAKKKYRHFADGAQWRAQWRQQRRDFRRHLRQQRWMWRQRFWGGPAMWSAPPPGTAPAPPPHAGYPTRILAGITLPVVSIVSIVFLVAFVAMTVSLARNGAVFGVELPWDVPFPLAIFSLIAVYAIVALPLRAIRRASYYALGGSYYGGLAAWDAMMSIGFVILVAWVAYQYVPEVREFVDSVPAMIETLMDR